MPNQLVRSAAAAAIVCLLIPPAGAVAQQRPHHPLSKLTATQSYQSPAASLAGTYISEAFFPSPLNLTITGMDRYGNLSGWISSWRGSYTGGETGDRWETWQRVFGRDGTHASYKNGQITVVFPNGATYILNNRGNELAGRFIADGDNREISFMKRSYGVASR